MNRLSGEAPGSGCRGSILGLTALISPSLRWIRSYVGWTVGPSTPRFTGDGFNDPSPVFLSVPYRFFSEQKFDQQLLQSDSFAQAPIEGRLFLFEWPLIRPLIVLTSLSELART